MKTDAQHIGGEQSPFYTITCDVNGENVLRLADQLIVYTAAYGATTNTNEYGYEIVVEDGVITHLGGNDLAIPKDGFVVSLHGETMLRLRTQIEQGMLVNYEPATQKIVFSYCAEGLRRSVTQAMEHVREQMAQAAEEYVYADYQAAQDTFEQLQDQAQALLSTADDNETAWIAACKEVIERSEALCRTLCDSVPVQYRGVWIRPSQKNAEQVDAYIKTLHDERINFVCVEGWFANGVIMNVPEGSLFGRHPKFDYDVLEAYVTACHKYGMECHLWMPIMNIGDAHSEGYETNTVPGRMPQWLSINNHGSAHNDSGFMMIDPANREARDYLLEFYKYIVTTYEIDCFELDYIRYFTVTDDADFGYTEAAFAGFEAAYGYGVTPQYDPSAPYWADWCQYRRDCVKEWVKEVREMLDRVAPHVLLAADVAFPLGHALHVVYQDYPNWLEEGLLDILHPMAYGDGFGDDIRKAVELAGDRCMVVVGLGAQGHLLRTEELERQTRENPHYGAYGDCFFEADAYFYKHLPPAVKAAVYRREAMPPFLDADAAVRTMLTYMIGHVEEVMVPLGGVTPTERETVVEALRRAQDAVQDTTIAPAAYASLRKAIASLANKKAARALTNDLYRAVKIACVKQRTAADL